MKELRAAVISADSKQEFANNPLPTLKLEEIHFEGGNNSSCDEKSKDIEKTSLETILMNIQHKKNEINDSVKNKWRDLVS